jgi:adenylylsulfate kinase
MFAPGVIHLAGLPAVGKTTIARALEQKLRQLGFPSEVFDGDEMRKNFFPELGFGRAAREENSIRTFRIAALVARHHVTALVSLIAPYQSSRKVARDLIRGSGIPYFLVHLQAPYDTLAARDPKGLYARHARGEIKGLTGIDDPFEPFEEPAADLVIDTSAWSLGDCVDQIYDGFVSRGASYSI